MSRITIATIKKFIRNNPELYIRKTSNFDSMTDCVQQRHEMFQLAERVAGHENNLGINGAWFVLMSRDYFSAFETDHFTGYRVSNCCGSFILAAPKQKAAA
jgi:adenosine deaminase